MYNYGRDSSAVNGSRSQNQMAGRTSGVSRAPSRSRPEDAYSNYQQKMKLLGRVKYINQLARLEYEDKLTELHSKYTTQTKKSVQNKLKAKNQIAQFIEEEDELDAEFEELMDYKYGASKWRDFYYENDASRKPEYVFCTLCDSLHTTTPQVHQSKCNYKELSRSPLYYFESLDRIKLVLTRVKSREAEELMSMIEDIRNSKPVKKDLQEIRDVVGDDAVLGKIITKLRQIVECTQD